MSLECFKIMIFDNNVTDKYFLIFEIIFMVFRNDMAELFRRWETNSYS